MFEGNLSSVVAGQTGDVGALRAVAWSELAAKLAAARDLRGVFAASRRGSLASFAPHAARALALREVETDRGKQSINPDALGHGKGPRAISIAAADEAGDRDREI
jgi:hypothetical protein